LTNVQNQKMALWSTENSALITEIIDHPMKRVLVVVFAGGDLEEIKGMEERLTQYGYALGCSEMQIFGRKGWEKALPHFENKSVILTKVI